MWMACEPGGRSCRFRSSPTERFAPVPFSRNTIVPTLLPWASFISTIVLAALASDRRMMVDDAVTMNSPLFFIATNYNQASVLGAISWLSNGHGDHASVCASAFQFWDGVYCL